MNAEQKQRAQEARQEWIDYEWSGADSDAEFEVVAIANKMAALLHELIDAPEPEQPNQSEQHLEMVNAPAPSVPDGWRPFLTDVITAAGLLEHGKRDKGLAGRIGKFAFAAMRAAPTPAEPPADVARDAEMYRWLTADHASAETRLDVNNIASSIQVRSYAATLVAIDVVIKRQGGES